MRFFSGIAIVLLQQPAKAFFVPNTRLRQFNSLYTSAADDQHASEQQTKVAFQSPKFKVYIEDTDAYGVIYNSNYVRAFERALLQYAPLSSSVTDTDESMARNKRWILSSIHNQKFRSSPALGEEYIIRGELIDDYTWEVEMITENESGVIVHNSAQVGLTLGINPLTSNDTTLNQNGKVLENRYTPYHDEFEHHNFDEVNSNHKYYIPIRNAMNFFERSRSDFLGGPDGLRKMQVEDDVIWLVASVENGTLFPGDESLDPEVGDFRPEDKMKTLPASTDSIFEVSPGKEVLVETSFTVKRRGMIVECHHTLWMDKDSRKKLLAQATCVMVAVHGSTKRPTSKLPQWLLDKFTLF